ALFGVQVILGAITAHYSVEGQHFYGIPLAKYLPYSLTRTWHLQTALFWIATSFLAAGLFLAPIVGGKEPRFQRLGVNILFGALILVVAGSLTGEFLSIHQKLGLNISFWIGHQGYEYIDLGKVWQIGLYVGLLLWLVLMLRGLWPALVRPNDNKELIVLFVGASAAIGIFYGAGLFIGAKTHLSVMEYWRWWVVHLWVEGFMEVFATVSMAFIFTYLGLIHPKTAARSVLFSASIFLVSGIPGTFHHLYFSGTPVSIMAIGASFSALEVIPLILMGLEASHQVRLGKLAPWMSVYRWPIRFFLGVCFWNFVGAGLFGFLINPPIALYYMQGLNTTAVHAHTATFGVYGLLSLGLILLILRWLKPNLIWNERPLAISFWCMNLGLALMVGLSLLPVGLFQAFASVDQGLWFARSSEFLQQPHIETLRWLRIVGDTIFLFGVASLAYFVVRWFLSKNPSSENFPELDEHTKPTKFFGEGDSH
ncbi:MAG: cbb3-type cytochrome c oxidase subunit I, partial [Planctomycetota bacterium]